jgi:hypothetical protein
MKGITRARPLCHLRRWSRLVEAVNGTESLTEETESIGGILLIHDLREKYGETVRNRAFRRFPGSRNCLKVSM